MESLQPQVGLQVLRQEFITPGFSHRLSVFCFATHSQFFALRLFSLNSGSSVHSNSVVVAHDGLHVAGHASRTPGFLQRSLVFCLATHSQFLAFTPFNWKSGSSTQMVPLHLGLQVLEHLSNTPSFAHRFSVGSPDAAHSQILVSWPSKKILDHRHNPRNTYLQ